MQEIFDLLLRNWWLVLAIIWFFTRGFGGSKLPQQRNERQAEPQQQELAIPTEPEERSPAIPMPWERAESEPVYQATPVPEAQVSTTPRGRLADRLSSKGDSKGRGQSSRASYGTQDYTAASSELGSNLEREARLSRLRKQQENKQTANDTKKPIIDFTTIDHRSVVQGKVWSQIFGLPRAKESHFTSTANRYSRYGRRTHR